MRRYTWWRVQRVSSKWSRVHALPPPSFLSRWVTDGIRAEDGALPMEKSLSSHIGKARPYEVWNIYMGAPILNGVLLPWRRKGPKWIISRDVGSGVILLKDYADSKQKIPFLLSCRKLRFKPLSEVFLLRWPWRTSWLWPGLVRQPLMKLLHSEYVVKFM